MKHLMGCSICATAKEGGRIVIATLLSLLLPLSFLLLARQSSARFLSSTTSDDSYTILKPKNYASFICSVFFRTEAITLVSVLVCMISAKAIIHGLPFRRVTPAYYWAPPQLYNDVACIVIYTTLVFVVLGLKGSVDAGLSDYVVVVETHMLRRLFFCVGLFETMIFWWKNVVDESCSVARGGATEYCLKAGMCLSFGGLWWWWLMEEAEALAEVPLAMQRVEVLDLAAWGVYSLAVMNGIVKVLVTSYKLFVLVLIHCIVERKDKNGDLLADYEDMV